MPRAKEAIDRFTELEVDLILGGHLHRAYIGNSLDLYSSKDRSSGIIIVQSGTSTSQRGRGREREKNTLNMIKIGDEVVRITHYMFFHETGNFEPVSRHIFPRAAGIFFRTIMEHEARALQSSAEASRAWRPASPVGTRSDAPGSAVRGRAPFGWSAGDGRKSRGFLHEHSADSFITNVPWASTLPPRWAGR